MNLLHVAGAENEICGDPVLQGTLFQQRIHGGKKNLLRSCTLLKAILDDISSIQTHKSVCYFMFLQGYILSI